MADTSDPSAPSSPTASATFAAAGDGAGPAWPPAGERYLAVRLHAVGGLGEVHYAEDAELGRAVALKRLRGGRGDDPDARRRFLREAEVTARLQHPGIVPVYGLTRDADGRPSYAMRFIEGESLDAAIKRFHAAPDFAALPFRGLVQHLVAVCHAVAYAHARGVVHRDLKPANIMLGPFGETLVVDWGLARSVGRGGAEPVDGAATVRASVDVDGEHTETGAAVGTPAYMAPEQAAGRWDVLGPAADVYALGGTLYALLTGTPPIANDTWPAMQQRIQRGDYPPPRALQPAAPAALEAVCRKAMALEPADRYASATALAADLNHWLADEAVSAGREPAGVRLRRWARKHPRTVAAALALALAAAGALGVVAWQREQRRAAVAAEQAETAKERDRAVAARARTRAALDAMVSGVTGDSLETQAALSEEQKTFLNSVLGYYEEFAAEPGEDKEGRERLAKAHQRLGLIRSRLGQAGEGAPVLRRAAELYAGLAADFPAVPAYRRDLARSQTSLGNLLAALGRRPEAEAAYRAALAVLERLAADFPATPDYRQDLAQGHNGLGVLLVALGRRPEAEAAYRSALAVQQKLVADSPAAPAYRQDLARSHTNLGVLLAALGRRPEAEAAYRSALALQEKLVAEFPAAATYRKELAGSHNNLGNLHKDLGRRPEAEAAYRAALAVEEKLVAEFPAAPAYRQELANSYHNLGNLLKEQGKRREAEAAHRTALAVREKLAADFPAVPAYRQDLARSHNNLGALLRTWGRGPEAEAAFRAAVALQEALAAESPAAPGYALELGGSYCNLGFLVLGGGDAATAVAWHAKAVDRLAPLAAAEPRLVTARQFLRNSHWGRAAGLTALRRYADALPDWERGLALDDGTYGDALRLGRADCLARLGRAAAAAAAAVEAAAASGVTADTIYACAGVVARASVAADNADAHAARAVDLLRQAVARGYRDVPHLLKDSDLDALRRRDDYAALLWDLADGPPPAE